MCFKSQHYYLRLCIFTPTSVSIFTSIYKKNIQTNAHPMYFKSRHHCVCIYYASQSIYHHIHIYVHIKWSSNFSYKFLVSIYNMFQKKTSLYTCVFACICIYVCISTKCIHLLIYIQKENIGWIIFKLFEPTHNVHISKVVITFYIYVLLHLHPYLHLHLDASIVTYPSKKNWPS